MTQAATRAVPQQGAVCTISTDPASGRLLVRWQAPTATERRELARQWWRSFGRHSQSCVRADGSRSVPLRLEWQILEWCSANGLEVIEG